MAKYGECISGRPSYQTHRQTYYPALAAAAAAAAASLNGEAEAVDASSGGAEKNSRSGGGGGGGGVGQGGARFPSSTNNKPTGTASVTTGTISQRDPVYPRSLAEEVVWRQRRFAWWGTTYLVDPLSAVHPPPSKIHPNPAQLKVQQILQQLRNKDGILVQEIDEGRPCLSCGDNCSGFRPHQWRKHCAICKCPRDVHDVTHKESVNVHDRLGLNKEGEEEHQHRHQHQQQQHPQLPASSSRVMPLNKGARPTSSDVYSWIPAGLTPDQIDDFMTSWPKDKVPKRNSQGDRWREHQLAFQLPRQDLALAYCRYVEPQNHTSYQDFVAARNDIALDIAYVKETSTRAQKCYGCEGNIPAGTFGVMAPKFGENVAWHPACFQCTTCAELLVDLTYCVHEEQLYCERHYAEQLKPRCSACDELIFSGEYTKAMSKDWHLGHFSCWQCDESLTGQRYVLRDEHPYCVKCYETVFANNCDDCNRVIGIDSKDLSYKDRHWHEACFLCNKCRLSLVDKQFGSKADKIFCGPCYDSMYATRCDGCGEIFRAGTKKMEYKSRQWHEKCFSCFVCKTPIGTKSFIPREQDIYCSGCYEEKFATRCVKCTKIITTGGVTYKNDPWHRECFTCTHCDKSLAGQRFTSKDEKPYCAECFGELFAKRCTACTKPITGIGGTRFISFEDRHWHNDCFQCASCNVTLVGKGFITDGADILCPECAKQRVL
ncbi:prickle planar cell polarity protein 3-like isoform X2 [Daphnia pulex]|uniref:prickle planar cell polarity protein 3-like isoform X2 n=1 Tax=Daphnia pulex TaxID=6669 RepID=UPI001EDDDE05|nr:prickle planar cell polarity protein 3-like isoform X2 [Daphnia pulex]